MSDERRTPENLTGADDQTLGEALGSAIRSRVETPTTRPPASSIAERAAARAKARHTRQAVVGIAASVALVAGGIAAWNALEEDQSTEVIVVDEPTASPALQPSAEPTPAPISEPTSEPENTPQTSSEESFEPPTAESLSTGTTLEWTEFDATGVFGGEVIDAFNVISVGDGRVLVNTYGPDGNQLMVSDNGAEWTAIPIPPDFAADRFDFAGGRWLITGWDTAGLGNSIQAFFSDDQGTTWTELAFDPSRAGETSEVAAAMVSGENMVIALEHRVQPDIAAVIVGRDLVPNKESIKGWTSVEGDTVSFTRDESSPPESFTLTAEEEDFLYEGDRSFIQMYHSNNGAVEMTGEFPAWEVDGYGATDGFHLFIFNTEGIMRLTSSDGRQWAQAPLTTNDNVLVDSLSNYHSSSTPGIVWTSGQASSQLRIERFDGVYSPPLVAELPTGIAHVERLEVGPAGIAMVAVPGRFPDTEVVPTSRIAKDGYELRYNVPPGSIMLWDLSENRAIYEWGAENAQTNMLPEGIRAVDGVDDRPDLLVFDDPETGEHLVTFTTDELAESQIGGGFFAATPEISTEQPERWMGWSAGGGEWFWQTLPEAFGLADTETDFANVELAVGRDFVIARVQPYSAVPSDTPGDDSIMLSGHAPLWFIATIE